MISPLSAERRALLVSEKRKTALALVGSALIHLLLLVLAGFWLGLLPEPPPPAPAAREALEMTLLPSPVPGEEEPASEPAAVAAAPTPAPQAAQFIDSDGLRRAETAPKSALFESDTDTRAGSPLPAAGDVPLPTVRGEEIPVVGFQDRNYSLGDGAAADPARALSPPEADQPAEAAPAATPTPAPTPERKLAKKGDLVFSKPDPVKPEALPTPGLSAREKRERLAMLDQTSPKKNRSGYRPETREARVDGSVEEPGETGVDAIGTPRGRYTKVIRDAIGSRWYYYVGQRVDRMNIGVVRVRFWIEQDGSVSNITILSNTSNETLAAHSVQSIAEASIPPIPDDLRDKLPDGRLEMTHTFRIY